MNWPSLRSDAPILRQNTEGNYADEYDEDVILISMMQVEVASKLSHVKMWLLRVADAVVGASEPNFGERSPISADLEPNRRAFAKVRQFG